MSRIDFTADKINIRCRFICLFCLCYRLATIVTVVLHIFIGRCGSHYPHTRQLLEITILFFCLFLFLFFLNMFKWFIMMGMANFIISIKFCFMLIFWFSNWCVTYIWISMWQLNPVIRTDCMCSVKCAEAVWNYKSGRQSAL